MPRRAAEDDSAPPRRRKRAAAAAAVVEAADERGFLMRAMLYSPKDLLAGLLACAAASAIIVNAVFLQSGPHPAPMFGSIVTIPPVLTSSNPMPRPRPAEAISPFDPKVIETRPPETRATEPKVPEQRTADARTDQKYADPLADLVRSVSGGQGNTPRPQPTQQGGNARRVAAVQRALTEYGYGQLKPTGMIGSDTQTAIQKFERERKLPVTGQVSDRLVRELAIVIGHPIE
ncbi:peptidoglycan-binding domain-containing protein [Bradyrhizobium sp. SRS-191]|uniref:peptidoglycan-binding domain-containing protein n=1 Tax=Bradyrhizobium sp. SRS-191 TaxID=2962606 RepID=UPI00211E4FC2|nr:peptidoglycan-binding domain-containing protein [Bradyrhizobium sp. SRS-191]